MIDVFTVASYVILIVATIYGLFFGLIKVLMPIASGLLSMIVMVLLKNWMFGFLFRWAVFQREHILARIVVILLVFIGGCFLFRWIFKVLDLITKLPIIHGFNKIFGGLAGLFEGTVLVWLLMYFVYLFPTGPFSIACFSQIQAAPLLTYLYEHNLVLFLFDLFTTI